MPCSAAASYPEPMREATTMATERAPTTGTIATCAPFASRIWMGNWREAAVKGTVEARQVARPRLLGSAGSPARPRLAGCLLALRLAPQTSYLLLLAMLPPRDSFALVQSLSNLNAHRTGEVANLAFIIAAGLGGSATLRASGPGRFTR